MAAFFEVEGREAKPGWVGRKEGSWSIVSDVQVAMWDRMNVIWICDKVSVGGSECRMSNDDGGRSRARVRSVLGRVTYRG